jgi:hypothetical protein
MFWKVRATLAFAVIEIRHALEQEFLAAFCRIVIMPIVGL